jgi:glutamate racemase
MPTGAGPDAGPRSAGPIGVFDSGVGGLSVLHEIRAILAREDLVFVADSRHVPYGDKSPYHIRARSLALGEFLVARGAKAVVVACNTATAAAAERLRAELPVPVVAMEPAVKPAAAATRTGVVGVLATVGTLESARFAALLARFGREVTVVTQPAPGLVEQVEAGDLAGPTTRRLVERYTAPLCAAGADTIVLGSTHFPFLRRLVAEVVGPEIAIIDTGAAVARQLARVLERQALVRSDGSAVHEEFWTSGDPVAVGLSVAALWGRPATVRALPDEVAG